MIDLLPRELLDDLGGSDCRRLLHGRGGYLPGLEHVAVDWFAPTLLVTFYAQEESNSACLDQLMEAAASDADIAIVVQKRHLPGSPKQCVYGKLPDDPIAHESGLRYHLDLERNQNHGFFLDMKPGRDWVREQAGGKSVLNLFAYTCSLSVAAIAGGAASVTNLDMAGGALSVGRKNHQLNFDTEISRRASYLAHNLFKSWGKLRRAGPFDLILIDPPSNQAGSFVAEKDYGKLVRHLAELTHPQSKILACLNSPHPDVAFLREQFCDFAHRGRLPGAPGFADKNAEAALKCLVFAPAPGTAS